MISTTAEARQLGKTFAKLSRPQNAVYPAVLTLLVTRVQSASWTASIACFIMMFCLYALAAGYNNLVDRQVDHANGRRDNPLTLAVIPRRPLAFFFGLELTAVIALQLCLVQPWSAVIYIVYLALLISYSTPKISVQSRGFAATILLSTCYGVLPVLLAFAQTNTISSLAWFVSLLQIPLLSALLLAKDYKDEHGDKTHGKRTPLVRYGTGGVHAAAALSWCTATGLVVVFGWQHSRPLAMSMLLATLVTYSWCIRRIHHLRGTQGLAFTRLTQSLLLSITRLLLLGSV